MVSPEKSSLSPVQRSARYVLVLFIVSVAVRAVFLVHYKMIDTDSAYYGNIARLFAAGHWQKALDPYWPPLYPFFASLPYRLGIGLEASGYDSITGPAEPRRPGNYHLLQFLQKNPGTILKKSLRNLPRALLDKIPSLMYWPLTLLCLFGLAYRKEIRRSVYDLIFGLWILVPVVIYSPLFLYRRFFTPALIPMIVWCALGLEELRRRLPRKIFQAGAGLGAILLLFLTNFSISSQSWPTLYKKAGVWLKSHAERPVVLSSRKPETSFYAEAEFRPLNAQKIEDLFDVLKKGNITHLVIDDYIIPSSHPQLADLLDARRAPPWLIPLFFETQDGHALILYKFQGS